MWTWKTTRAPFWESPISFRLFSQLPRQACSFLVRTFRSINEFRNALAIGRFRAPESSEIFWSQPEFFRCEICREGGNWWNIWSILFSLRGFLQDSLRPSPHKPNWVASYIPFLSWTHCDIAHKNDVQENSQILWTWIQTYDKCKDSVGGVFFPLSKKCDSII